MQNEKALMMFGCLLATLGASADEVRILFAAAKPDAKDPNSLIVADAGMLRRRYALVEPPIRPCG